MVQAVVSLSLCFSLPSSLLLEHMQGHQLFLVPRPALPSLMLQAGNPNFEDLRQEYEKIKAYW